MSSRLEILDASILEQLQLLSEDEPAFFYDLLDSYIEQSNIFIHDFSESYTFNNIILQKKLLHKFLGASSSVGASSLVTLLENLYQKISQNQSILPTEFDNLIQFISLTQSELLIYLQNANIK